MKLRITLFLMGSFIMAWEGLSQSADTFLATRVADSSTVYPEVAIDDLNWLSGYWRGKALGGDVEEIWSQPLGESIMGSFRLVVKENVIFHEIFTLKKHENGGLVIRLKHFDADMKGWEKKEETVDFRLILVKGQTAYFDGMTYMKVGENQLKAVVRIKKKDGQAYEEEFLFDRLN